MMKKNRIKNWVSNTFHLNYRDFSDDRMNIVDLIRQWTSNSKDLNLNKIYTEYGIASHHYLTEIIRYWNHLHFIVKKTLRSLPKDSMRDKINIETCLYLSYRYFWEAAQFSDVLKELTIDETLPERSYLQTFYDKLSSFKWEIALQNKSTTEKLSIKYAIPSFIINTLLPIMDYTKITKNIKAMDEGARNGIFYLRVQNSNDSITPFTNDFSSIIEEFARIGVKTKPDNDFPSILQVSVKDKVKILKSKYYKEKKVVFQDKASYAAVLLLDPQPDDKICDLCAAPGIKTSLIAHQTNNKAFIVAGDFHHTRASEMVSVLKSYRVSNVHSLQWDGIQPPLQDNSFDKILLDAPCTGSGTFTSNPVLKWRQNARFLRRHIFLQEKLLKSALTLLKKGGTLVYSTCSLYPEEGEYQIAKISNDQIEFVKVPSWLPPTYTVNGSGINGSGRFNPADHQTIGFFVSKMIKKQ
jgi:16S rRNA (cytosine967-C5)-methyltransferase